MKNKPLVIAHRGYSGKFPENTLAAFRGAIESGAQMIELDVHLTRDGALLVTHDFELGRTCNGRGRLSDLSSAELRRLDAGSWFHNRFSGEHFPVLGEVLALARAKVELNVELKEETLTSDAAYDAMAEKTLELLSRHGMEKNVIISSFDWQALKRVREKNPDIRLGLLNHEPEQSLHWGEVGRIRPFSYHPNQEKLDAAQVKEIKERGLKIFPYTANQESTFQRLFDLQVNGIITNEVEDLRNFIAAQAAQ